MFDHMNNPWAKGGKMASQPWQRFQNRAWGREGNRYLQPKTKEEVRNEELLQLAVLAAIVAAPAISDSTGGETSSSPSSASSGESPSAGQAVEYQGSEPDLSVLAGSDSTANGEKSSMIDALRPFLQEASRDKLLMAASQSSQSLEQEIQRQQEKCDCPPKPKFRTAEWDRENGDCECGNSKSQSPSKSRKNANNSLRLLDSLMDLIKSDSTIERELRQASNCKSSCGPKVSFGAQQKLFSHVGAAALPLMREEYVWEGGFEKGLDFHNKNDAAPSKNDYSPWTINDLKKRVEKSVILTLLEKRVYENPNSPFDGSFNKQDQKWLNPSLAQIDQTGRTDVSNGTIELNRSLSLDQAFVIYAYELQNASNFDMFISASSFDSLEGYLRNMFEIETDAILTGLEVEIETGIDAIDIPQRVKKKIVKLIPKLREAANLNSSQLVADLRADPSKHSMKTNELILRLRQIANPRFFNNEMLIYYTNQYNNNH